ncbi:hypothetical protein GALMADRAFT_1341969 [Galerina marginata CBS 339.88]|uniref:CHAT domain-containing protein n=1 Tax=Galerina marginata (strain CBS 339.88) TaxID=685588 RepID=A0A067T2Z3_GALM3|nr:hypothetical protein GALMADRAFT_1341969 [Galerina marginata CBS 339.88]
MFRKQSISTQASYNNISMEDDLVSSSPQLQDSETQPPISSDTMWYMTDISIERLVDNSNQLNPTVIIVEVFSSEKKQGEALLFEKTSSQEWKHNGTIAVTKEVKLIARWNATENFAIIHLVKTEMEKLKENAGLHNQIVQEFVTETEGPTLRLVFKLDVIPPEDDMTKQNDGDLSNQSAMEALSQEPELMFDIVLKMSDSIPEKPQFLNTIGKILGARFRSTRNALDIENSVLAYYLAVRLLPIDGVEFRDIHHDYGFAVLERYNLTGKLADIDQAVESLQKAVQLTPDGRADLPGWLNDLGISFQSRFDHTGDLADISEAISAQQKAVQLTPDGCADLPSRLNDLGISFQIRFERTGDLADISEAISAQQKAKAVQLAPDGHAKMSGWLSNLGNSFQSRFDRTGDLADISQAISAQQKAVQLTPDGHADLPAQLNNLGISFQSRFGHTGNLADISEAISAQRKAVQLTLEGHANMPAWLNNLGISFESRFESTGDLADLAEAISAKQKAVQLTPDGHANMSTWLNNLGISFLRRFGCTDRPADVHIALSHFKRSATYLSGSPSIRLDAAKQWARLSQSSNLSESLEAYRTAIHLISLVAGLEQTIQKRYTNLIDLSDLSASAAAAAFRFGQHDLALEWLEQGRSLVWRQLNDLRTPLDDLRAHNLALADNLLRVSRALESAGSRVEAAGFTIETSMAKKMSIQDEAHLHIRLAKEWDQLLTEVRAMPHFENFLKPASCSTLLKHIPDSGPVVVINIHKDRSDALALVSGIKEPLHIPLLEFSYEKAHNLRTHLKTHLLNSGVRMRGSEPDTRGMRYKTGGGVVTDVLHELWTSVVKPILDGLGYSASPSNISRIWWCVTGPLVFLPIHAAGIYTITKSTPGICSTLADFAVSSYTPTVRALVERVQSSREVSQRKMELLMISQPDTPMLRHIPGTKGEVRAIEVLLSNHKIQHLCLESENATVNEVKLKMGAYNCIHFACHAAQDTTNPLKSGFYLHDGQLELSEIIKEQLVGADLAFLSACQTSTGDEKLSEEAVHLAGGMLAAGYRGVVATMWSIGDRYGPEIAKDFYSNLIADDKKGLEGLSSDGAARALHYAMQRIRQRHGDSEELLLTWVPYVHFGL